jgi:hypothetical protein
VVALPDVNDEGGATLHVLTLLVASG